MQPLDAAFTSNRAPAPRARAGAGALAVGVRLSSPLAVGGAFDCLGQ
jgi:hypothetical protein